MNFQSTRKFSINTYFIFSPFNPLVCMLKVKKQIFYSETNIHAYSTQEQVYFPKIHLFSFQFIENFSSLLSFSCKFEIIFIKSIFVFLKLNFSYPLFFYLLSCLRSTPKKKGKRVKKKRVKRKTEWKNFHFFFYN